MPKSEKGSAFERRFCGLLSEWWTQDLATPRTDVFWRVHGSGGRAKARGRKGLKTYGEDGDIRAADPIGVPMTETFTMELKKGYSKYSPFDVVDKPAGRKPCLFDQWIVQASESSKQAGSRWWMIVFARDRRDTMFAFPGQVYKVFPKLSKQPGMLISRDKKIIGIHKMSVFLSTVTPAEIKTLHREPWGK